MSLNLHVAQLDDIDEIFEFENKLLIQQIPDETERMLKAWNSRWRKESLEHYLQLGWSFVARADGLGQDNSQGPIVGLFLAQVLLFFDGHTQSLWIEHISYQSLEVRDQLCELAYKLCKEKHLQKVYFPNSNSISNVVQNWQAAEWKPQTLYVNTTKI